MWRLEEQTGSFCGEKEALKMTIASPIKPPTRARHTKRSRSWYHLNPKPLALRRGFEVQRNWHATSMRWIRGKVSRITNSTRQDADRSMQLANKYVLSNLSIWCKPDCMKNRLYHVEGAVHVQYGSSFCRPGLGKQRVVAKPGLLKVWRNRDLITLN